MWCDTPRTVLTRYWHHPVWTFHSLNHDPNKPFFFIKYPTSSICYRNTNWTKTIRFFIIRTRPHTYTLKDVSQCFQPTPFWLCNWGWLRLFTTLMHHVESTTWRESFSVVLMTEFLLKNYLLLSMGKTELLVL
jgi:hypothetical protein